MFACVVLMVCVCVLFVLFFLVLFLKRWDGLGWNGIDWNALVWIGIDWILKATLKRRLIWPKSGHEWVPKWPKNESKNDAKANGLLRNVFVKNQRLAQQGKYIYVCIYIYIYTYPPPLPPY